MLRRWVRFLWTLVWLAFVLAGAAWVAEHPGRVRVEAGPWLIDTSFAGLALAMAALAMVTALLFYGWRQLHTVPGRWRENRRLHRLEDGTAALLDGLTHAAAGDVLAARQAARRVGHLLERPALAALMTAEAAEAAGDTAGAARQYQALRGDGATRLLGLAGLARLAVRAGDDREALVLMAEAEAAAPATPWVLRGRFEAEARLGQWPEARATLARAMRAGTWNDAEGRRRLACVLHELGHREDALASELGRRLDLAREAHRLAPELVVATLHLARLEAEGGRRRRARGLLAEAWAAADGPTVARQLFPALLEMDGASIGGDGPRDDAAEGRRRLGTWQVLGRMVRPEQSDDVAARRAGHYALAEAALAAGLIGQARRHTDAAEAGGPVVGPVREWAPDRLQARLQAAVAEAVAQAAETPDVVQEARAKAAAWQARAAVASPEAAWTCRHCGRGHDGWQAVCTQCAAFDNLAWRRPAVARPARLNGAAERLALSGDGGGGVKRLAAATVPAEDGTARADEADQGGTANNPASDGGSDVSPAEPDDDVETAARRGER